MKLVVLTSNNYVHCLPPFAYLFNRYWGDDQAVMVLGYDNKPPKPLPRNFSFHSIGQQADYDFSAGLLRALEIISEPIFTLFLEDYFLSAPVLRHAVYALYDTMVRDASISKVDLTDDRLKVDHHPISLGNGLSLIQSDDEALFQMSLQAAIWRADMIRQFAKGDENPWVFEKSGTKRVIKARREGKFTGRVLGCVNPPVKYVNAIGGEGTMPGQWALKRFPPWMISALEGRGLMSGRGV